MYTSGLHEIRAYLIVPASSDYPIGNIRRTRFSSSQRRSRTDTYEHAIKYRNKRHRLNLGLGARIESFGRERARGIARQCHVTPPDSCLCAYACLVFVLWVAFVL